MNKQLSIPVIFALAFLFYFIGIVLQRSGYSWWNWVGLIGSVLLIVAIVKSIIVLWKKIKEKIRNKKN